MASPPSRDRCRWAWANGSNTPTAASWPASLASATAPSTHSSGAIAWPHVSVYFVLFVHGRSLYTLLPALGLMPPRLAEHHERPPLPLECSHCPTFPCPSRATCLCALQTSLSVIDQDAAVKSVSLQGVSTQDTPERGAWHGGCSFRSVPSTIGQCSASPLARPPCLHSHVYVWSTS